MLNHGLTLALGKFRRSPVSTLANLLTLALGLACFIAAYGIATYWLAADQWHARADRTLVLGQSVRALGQDAIDMPNSLSSPTPARFLPLDFPEIESIARADMGREVAFAADDAKMLFDVAFVEPAFLDIFDFEFVQGERATALAAPDGIVLTENAARALFGTAPALGRLVRMQGRRDGRVTGVIAAVRQPSFMGESQDAVMSFDVLANWQASPRAERVDQAERWLEISTYTFLVLAEGQSPDAFNAALPAFLDRRVPPEQKSVAAVSLRAFPVRELSTFNLDRIVAGQSGVQLTAVTALVGLGLLTLGIACLNSAILAGAQASTRVQEAGIRKVMGAERLQIMSQCWLEALLLSMVAFVIALGVLQPVSAMIEARAGIDIVYAQGSLATWGVQAALIVLVGLLIGSWPARVLAGVKTSIVARSGKRRGVPWFVTHLLVGLQFASASFLLIMVIVMAFQRSHLEEIVLAPREEPIVLLNNLVPLDVEFEALQVRLAAVPGVREVSVVDKPLLGPAVNLVQFARSAEPGATAPSSYIKAVGYDYFRIMNLPLLAGRVFDAGREPLPVNLFPEDTSSIPTVIIDRAYAARLGFTSAEAAVGEIIYVPDTFTAAFGRAAQPVSIVGVTEREPTKLEDMAVEGTVYFYNPDPGFGGQYPLLRLEREALPATLDGITRAWDELAPAIPVSIRFFDAMFEQSIRTHTRVGQFILLLALCAFVIACVGQLSIAIHVAERRRFEIGVRKCLGATTAGLVRLMLRDFSRPILLANLLTWPAAWFTAQTYLQSFADRIELTPVPFVISLGIAIAISWSAVGGTVFRAASAKPVLALRYE